MPLQMSSKSSCRSFSRCLATLISKLSEASDRRDSGWALIAVLLVLVVLSVLAASTTSLTVNSHRLSVRLTDRLRMNAILDAGIERSILGISDRRTGNRWRVDGVPRQFQFDGVDMLVSVQDEAGKIDLNSSDRPMLINLLLSVGLERGTASDLADRIMDWRTIVASDRTRAKIDSEYVDAGYAYHPRHGLFQSVNELQLVRGMTPAIFERIRPALTIYSKQASPQLDVAPPQVLKAIYANDDGKVETMLAQRNSSPGQDAGPLQSQNNGSTFQSWGHAFSISVAANQFGKAYLREAVIIATGDERNPYLVLAWR